MEWYHLYIIIGVVVVLLGVGFFYLRKRVKSKISEQQTMVDQHKVATSILVLEKRKGKISEASIPKNLMSQIPKIYKIKKVPLIKAKIGNQVLDLICDEAIFDKIPEKNSVVVEIAGLFICSVKPVKR
jgi:hypothetical protein